MDAADDIPPGLVAGQAPLLMRFLQRRYGMRCRLGQVRAMLALSCPPAMLVREHNYLVDTLCGRRPA